MLSFSKYITLFLLIIVVGCSGIAKYDDDEVAAVVKEEEITVGDLRLLYPDDRVLDYLPGYVKIALVKQEVVEMGLDIDKFLEEHDGFEKLPPKNTKDESEKQIREYAKSQAKKLNMTAEQFQKMYGKKINEQNAYLNAYINKMVEEEQLEEIELEEYVVEFDNLLTQLKEENEGEIDILIE